MTMNRTQILEENQKLREEIRRLEQQFNTWNYEGNNFPAYRTRMEKIYREKTRLSNQRVKLFEEAAKKFLTEPSEYGHWQPKYKPRGCRAGINIKPAIMEALKKEVKIQTLEWHIVEDIVKKMIEKECQKSPEYVALGKEVEALRKQHDAIEDKMDKERVQGVVAVKERNMPLINDLERKIQRNYTLYNTLEKEAQEKIAKRRAAKPKDTRLGGSAFDYHYHEQEEREKTKQKVAEKVLGRVKL